MKVDNPNAYRFIMQDEIYLLEQDKVNKPQPAARAVAQAPAIEVKTPHVEFNYMGKNNKNFTILVNYANEEFIPATHLTALENIIKRKDLSLDDIAILNTHTYHPIKLEQINGLLKPARLLVLGSKALPAGMSVPELNVAAKGPDGLMILYSFSFDEMMDNTENKKTFWEQMKKL